MDDYFEDLDGDYAGGSDDYGDDGYEGSCDDGFSDAGADAEVEDGSCGFPEWQDWMIIGPLSEEIARERREQERLGRNNTSTKTSIDDKILLSNS